MPKVLPDFLIIPSILIKDENLLPVDYLVYGVIYWCTKLKLQKCIFSNKAIADLVDVSMSSVSHGLTRLSQGGYIEIILNDENHRTEIIPLITYVTPSKKLLAPWQNLATPPSKKLPHNKNNIIRTINKNNISKDILGESPFGNNDINYLTSYLKEKLELPVLDGTIQENRRYAYNAIKKFESVEKVALIIDAAAQSEFWRNNVTSFKSIYYKGVQILSNTRGGDKIVEYRTGDS